MHRPQNISIESNRTQSRVHYHKSALEFSNRNGRSIEEISEEDDLGQHGRVDAKALNDWKNGRCLDR